MKKFRSILLCTVFALTGLVFSAPEAKSHTGTCSASGSVSWSNPTSNPGTVHVSGSYGCNVSHPQRRITVRMQKRVSGVWQTFATETKTCSTSGTGCSHSFFRNINQPCDFAWRASVFGESWNSATGWHLSRGATSSTVGPLVQPGCVE